MTAPQQQQLCPHVTIDSLPEPQGTACQECGSTGPLRLCVECGHVGCCESQRGHNTQHAKAEGHPGIRSMPLNDDSWTWCYECQDYVA
jgi:uncharacterized UBP type Zn finger protein